MNNNFYGGMPNPSMGMPQGGMGMPNPSMGMPQGGMGMPNPSMGMPQGGMGMPNPSMGMPQGGMGMPNPAMGMNRRYGVPAGNPYGQQNMRMSSNGPLPVGWMLNGRYTVTSVLGKGAFSFVYLVLDGYTQTYMAIKELYVPGLCSRRSGSSLVEVTSPESMQQFGYLMARYQEEYTAVTSMAEEPGIVGYYELFYENNTAYMVMEYVRGMSVRQFVESSGGRLAPVQVQQIMKDVLAALSAMHSRGYLHRDIKPENVIILQDGTIKLIDFGAARLSDREQDDAELKYDKVFTQGYAPPEQFADSRRQGPETDVYAAGALSYYMLSGEVPYPSMDRKVSSYDPLRPLEMIRTDIPRYMIKAIVRAMELKPELRFRTAKEFSRCLCGKKATRTAGQVKRGKLFRKMLLAVAAVAVLACVASVVFERILPNPVRDLITDSTELAVLIPVDGSEESEREMWEDIASGFTEYAEDKSGHTVELQLMFAPAGEEYEQQLEQYISENGGPVLAVRDERLMPGVQPDNPMPDLERLITSPAPVLGYLPDGENVSVPVSFDMPVLYINEKIFDATGWQDDVLTDLDIIAQIETENGILPLTADPLLADGYAHVAASGADPLLDFCSGKAMCHIGFAGDLDMVELALAGYYTVAALPEGDYAGRAFAREWGVVGEAETLQLNAAQVFLGYIFDDSVQEIICVRNDGGFPANSIALRKYLEFNPVFEQVFNKQ